MFLQWSKEAIKKREYAGKKAKIAAAELAKLSRRVCGQYNSLRSVVTVGGEFEF